MSLLLNACVPMFSRRSMAAVSHSDRIYFFGGVGSAGTESILDVAADLWCFDIAILTWRQIPQAGVWPSPRRCAGWIALDDRLLLWGGSGIYENNDGSQSYNFLNDEWAFDIDGEIWQPLKPSDDYRLSPIDDSGPSPRYTPVLHQVGNELFLFSGYTEDRLGKRKLNDLWVRSGSIWARIPKSDRQGYSEKDRWPGVRYGSMSATDATSVYVCGGFSDDGDHNDLWAFDMNERRWRLLSPDRKPERTPEARYCAAFARHEHLLFLFGGRSRRFPQLQFNDLWMYDLNSSQWSQINGNRSPHRYDAMAEYPAYHAKASSAVVGHYWYIWGGEGNRGHVSDFWRFNFQTLQWQMIQAARPDDPKFW